MMVLGLATVSANAQLTTTVTITSWGDSTWSNVYCPPPVQPYFYISGDAAGYVAGDSVDVFLDFGDGQDTLVREQIWTQWNGYWGASVYHTYNAKGIYNVRYIATGPDGNADTVDVAAEIVVGDTCGNISGKIYHDMNSDCQFNAGDVALPYAPVQLFYNSQNIGWGYTDQNGDYFLNAPTGNVYEVKLGGQMAIYGYSVTCPASGKYSIPALPSTGNDFGLTCTSGFDLQANVWSQRFRPGVVSSIYPYVFNASCSPVSGQAKLILDDPRLTYVGATNPPNQISGDTLIWNFTSLNNTSYWYWWYNSMGTVKVLTDVNAILGDSICVKFMVTPTSGDLNPANNTVVVCREISNSLDPNAKQVSPVGAGPSGNVPQNTEFTYNVQFQNTGTDTAYNIYILDTLDADLNVSTFTPVASSHPMKVDILPGNVARFTFSNIMLVDSFKNEPLSHGWVSYKISAKPNLSNGTQLKNTAYIYFDFNSAVVTNTTLNTVGDLSGVNELQPSPFISLYPNPTSSNIVITLHEKQLGADILLIDALGQVVMREKATEKEINMNVSTLPAGIYTLKLNTGENTAGKKVVIIK